MWGGVGARAHAEHGPAGQRAQCELREDAGVCTPLSSTPPPPYSWTSTAGYRAGGLQGAVSLLSPVPHPPSLPPSQVTVQAGSRMQQLADSSGASSSLTFLLPLPSSLPCTSQDRRAAMCSVNAISLSSPSPPSSPPSQVTVQAGCRVQQLADALKPHGLTLQNYASIREQQIGGFTQVGGGGRHVWVLAYGHGGTGDGTGWHPKTHLHPSSRAVE